MCFSTLAKTSSKENFYKTWLRKIWFWDKTIYFFCVKNNTNLIGRGSSKTEFAHETALPSLGGRDPNDTMLLLCVACSNLKNWKFDLYWQKFYWIRNVDFAQRCLFEPFEFEQRYSLVENFISFNKFCHKILLLLTEVSNPCLRICRT